MAEKYWWLNDSQQDNGSQKKKYWWLQDSADKAGAKITDRVNTWLKNHNTYISNYQKRTSGRKYSYEDSYVGDSANWLSTISQQKSNFDAEADSILSYMDLYKDHLDKDWMAKVRDTLSSARLDQGKIFDYATKDNEWWSSFADEDQYNTYQRYDSYSKKYSGLSAEDLEWASSFLEDGEEKNWLTSYMAPMYNDEMLNYDTADAEKRLQSMERILASYDHAADSYNRYQNNPEAFRGSEYEDLRTMAEAYLQYQQKFGSKQDLEKLINETKLNINNAKRIQEGHALAGVTGNQDFADKSGYVSTESDDWYRGVTTKFGMGYDDLTYEYINGKDNGMRSEIYGKAVAGDAKTDAYDLYDRMTDEQIAIYNYHYATGGKETAEKYLDSIIESLSYDEASDRFSKMKDKTALELLFSIEAGVDQFQSGIENLFSNDDYIPTSATQYTSGMVREDLGDVGFKMPDWMGGASIGQGVYDLATTTANMVPSIMVSSVVSAINPAAGAAVGAGLMGASSAGNAYQEALNLGYDKSQARAYSTLVGASEAGLSYLLSGIGKLGGKLSGKAVTSLASKFDNAFARLAVEYGANMVSEGAEEYLQEILTPMFKNLALRTDEEIQLLSDDAIYSFLLGSLSAGFMEGGSTISTAWDMRSGKQANIDAVKKYGDSTAELIQEGLLSEVGSESRQFAEIMKRKTDRGKSMSGYEIRKQVKANDAQFAVENYDATVSSAEKQLTELGETQNVTKIAKLVAKKVTGQELTRSEISTLARSQYGAQVAKEMRDAARAESGAKSFDISYKSLEDRIGTEARYSVSDDGQATNRKTGEAITLGDFEVTKLDNSEMTIKPEVGEEAYAGDIDFEDDDKAYAFSAVSNIENITPAGATAMLKAVDFSKPVSAQLNGLDEAYTHGFHGYSEADLKAGKFTKNLTEEQMMTAYEQGKAAQKERDDSKEIAYKKMRTDVEATVSEKENVAKQKARNLTITYNRGNGEVVSIDEANIGDDAKRSSAVKVAEILHDMGLGTRVEFFSSYLSKTLKDKKGNPARVFINDNGVEQRAYSGVYRKKDGTIRVDLNAYNGKGLTLYALAHELTHFIQQWSDRKYKVLVDFLMKEYENTDMTMHARVLNEQARLKRIRGEDVSYKEAFDEVVANAMTKMFDDGKLVEKLVKLKEQDKTLAQKLWDGFKKILAKFIGIYDNQHLFKDADDLVEMKETFEQLQNMFAEALVEASENYQAYLFAKEAGLDVVAVEDVSQYSYSSLAEAAGFVAMENEDGTRSFTRDGKKVSKVTVEDIDNSPIGAFINFSVEMKDISDADAKRQKEMFAEICTMACKTNDFAMTMQFVGSAVFTGMKANADKQYGTTYDFPSICTKTQAVIDAMSAKMKTLGRGLNTDEIVQLYSDVFASGNPVPCPECYVFSRWIGIGGLLDNIKKYQDYYGDMAVEDVANAYRKMKAEVSKFAEEQGISFGKAKGALTSKLTKEFNKLTEKVEKAQNQGEKVKPADLKRLEELEPMMNTVKSMTWLENVYFADSSLKTVNPKFRVPNEVLFDLNNGEAFATQYKEAWAFRTTQGAGYGKAITPYADARLGEGVLVTNNTTNAIKGKAQGSLNNYFLNQKGKLDKQSRDALKKARLKQKIQAFIGGQRFQSTSDARYENASDYLLAALEMQAMGGMVQAYTKVDGAVPAFSAWGFSINQSLMPLNGGLDADGNVKDTAVGGMKPSVAFENRKKHESAGTITIGVNDNHIRAMFKQLVRDFIIPYHASGGKADVVAEFRRIQEGKEAKGKAVRSTDYSRTQSDKVLSDEVLRWQGKTDAQIQRIHEIRNARIAILTGGKPNMTVVRSNRFLSALYDKLNGGEWDGVKLAKSKVESQIFPNEFWDQTVTYEESAKITKDYLEYCEDLGFLHRFSGMIPSNGKLVPASGYNENGERVQLTDLAYKYDEKGNKTAEVEEFFWKVLTDRRMYDNNGNYLPQKVVTLNDTTADTVTGFAKHNQGRQYDKAKAEALAKKIRGEQYSEQDTEGYNTSNLAWAIERGIISESDQARFWEAIAEIQKLRYNSFARTKNGAYIIETVNTMMFTDGDYKAPTLSKVIVFPYGEYVDTSDERTMIRNEARLTGRTSQSTKAIERVSGPGFVTEYYTPHYRADGREIARGEGTHSGGTASQSGGRGVRYGGKDGLQPGQKVNRDFLADGKLKGNYTVSEISEMFDAWNSDPELTDLSKKVFAKLQEIIDEQKAAYWATPYPIRFKSDAYLKKGYYSAPNGIFEPSRTDGDYGITYNLDYFRKASDQEKARILLHEAIHACTVGAIKSTERRIPKQADPMEFNPGDDWSDTQKAALELIQVFSQVRVANERNEYGQKNVYEMVAEMSNPEFRAMLKKERLWNRIVDAIKRIFGIEPKTAYDAVSNALEKILELDMPKEAGEMYSSHETDGSLKFSEHDTDYSNRSLLANAFEGITKSSAEYKLIQQYKGYIAELNSLENKLSEFNQQIYKIRFGKGEYDAEKLTRLEDEARKIAESINKYDQYLLSLEASEPLRKVIERERKKEAQKTKDHVEEIQQNKRVRAEQTELRYKIRKTIRDLDKILKHGNKQKNVKEDLQPVVTKALQAAEILFTDNYGTYDMLRNGIGADMSDAEEALVNACAKMLRDLDKMPTDGYENWQARQEAENRLKTKMSKLNDVFARERKRLNNTTVSSILGELADAYASLEKSEQSYVQGAYSEAVHNFLKSLQQDIGGTIVKDMTKNQLESVYAAYKMVLTTVRKANTMFNEELKMSRAQLGNAVIEEVRKAGGVNLLGTKLGDAISQALWNNMKPIWVANRIGSETFGKLMLGLFKGQYIFAVDAEEAKQFKLSMDEKYHPREWDAEKLYDFESSTGKPFSLNLQQIMSLYAFSKRDQAFSHLLNGGFVFENNSTAIVEKDGKKKTYIHKGATSYKLNEATINEIIDSLTAEQKAYVDEMQAYLSDVMGAKGNEVSMQLYGIKMFNEKFYFPLRSSGAYMERAKEAELKKQQGQINLVNSGFTHAVKPQAKNPIILSGFMDVWAEHCNEMSMYHSMVLPMEDFRKVYNYSTVHDENLDSASVYQTIQDAYGDAATAYIDQLYRELNAGATIDPRETPYKQMISNFKKSAVMLSASVVVQQFSAIGRAFAYIDPTYFNGAKIDSGTNLSEVDEMKKYAPVAIIKEMGGFDTGTKGSAKSYIMAEKYSKGERKQALLKDEQYRSDVMGYLPAKADEKTWCAIWEAVKRETNAKHPEMDVKSEEFLKLVGERFSDVIERTQVYDSVLARSANMRSKGGLMQMATAFMAEPTTTINLLEDAIRSGNKEQMARTFGAVAVSIVLNNALASIVYAMRDDDEDETLIEKYFQSFTSGMIDDINPMTYYPFLKDVWSLFQGYDVERTDMSVIADLRDALKKTVSLLGKDTSSMDDDELAEHSKNVWGAFGSLLDAGCSVFGVPFKNIRREAKGIINTFSTIGKDLSGRTTTWNSFWDKVGSAVKDTIPGVAWTKGETKSDQLHDAIVSGDKSYAERIKATYKDESSYRSAVRKGLRDNDSRIHEAAQARVDGNIEEYKRIFKEIQKEGKFTFDDIMSAINSEESSIQRVSSLEKDYLEFAEPAGISMDVFASFLQSIKGLETKYDEWGDVEVSKRDQVLEIIDSLPLTWKQKDALYLAAGYAESKIWDVPW